MPTRNESLAAVFRSIPENNADVKVTPDLETPGKIARDCEKPNMIISLRLISINNFFFLPYISDRASNKDIKIEIIEIENKLLNGESEKLGQNDLIIKPNIDIGILATIIYVASLVLASLKKLRLLQIEKNELINK